ncbi:FKBP-type peptidyl-prolyl cis-trans isomerase [uncultured Jatrophihabitans sp.]|uniref:FKBP-type peptidyl-prolyl cis-trans isomerase n=1 Tax=uncultured Jatrophihabitans sp. TaxID=1610747 RepID=UPI0035CC45D5
MDARSKRREATRRQLEQQLKERQAREARRKRATLITSVVGTVVVIALVVVLVAVFAGGNDPSTKSKAGSSASSSPSATAPTSPAVQLAAPAACAAPTGKPTASFDGVTVTNAINLKTDPKATSKSATTLKALACDDLVVGKGKAATPTSTVSVQYSGVLYKDGTKFDSSWASGKAASFMLTRVVQGFTQGIGGTGKVTPMRVGGRRAILVPAQLGYGASGQGAIPANADLVFVVDLLSVK